MPLLLVLALACVTLPVAEEVRPGDADGDHVPDAEDCAPRNSRAYPGATEHCNVQDDDCDGEIDEGLATYTYYEDADRDGYGDDATVASSCRRPSGYLAFGGDCDPTDPDVNPGAREECDDVDADCDGDLDDVPASRALYWYLDADGDGFGDAAIGLAQCTAPDGYVGDGEDCDDTRADVNPAMPEVCDDADTDEDCDGRADEADDWEAGGEPMYLDQDDDGHGEAGGALHWRCAPGNGYARWPNDCRDLDPDTWPGAPERCDGVDNDCDGPIDEDPVDPVALYFDGDGDGDGDPTRVRVACGLGPRWVTSAADCDDGDPSRYAGAAEADCADPVDYNCDGYAGPEDADLDGQAACEECDDGDPYVCTGCPETCDGRDEDCDGSVDESDALDAVSWYSDRDADGHGNIDLSLVACEQPPGHVASDDDCDDANPLRYPGAVEVCWDGIDQDCDGADPRCARP